MTKSVSNRGEVGKIPIPHVRCRPLIVLLSSWPLCFNFPQRNQLSSSFRSKIPLLISFTRKIEVLFHTASVRYITINQSKFTACTQLPLLRFVARLNQLWLNLLQNEFVCQGKPLFFFSVLAISLCTVLYQLQLLERN